jgi:hypothetical protein
MLYPTLDDDWLIPPDLSLVAMVPSAAVLGAFQQWADLQDEQVLRAVLRRIYVVEHQPWQSLPIIFQMETERVAMTQRFCHDVGCFRCGRCPSSRGHGRGGYRFGWCSREWGYDPAVLLGAIPDLHVLPDATWVAVRFRPKVEPKSEEMDYGFV